jgi:hypothetical protein
MFGSPIFAPWALNISYPRPYESFVNDDGSRGVAWKGLAEPYEALTPLVELLALYGGAGRAHLFMPLEPGKRFSQTAQINGHRVDAEGSAGGQCIVIDAEDGCLYICGYRCTVKVGTPNAAYPQCKSIRAERGFYNGRWHKADDADIVLSQYDPYISVSLHVPSAIRLSGI